MPRPDKLPDWAMEDNEDVNNPVATEPPVIIKQFGCNAGDTLPHNWFNYQMRLISQWIKYLDEK